LARAERDLEDRKTAHFKTRITRGHGPENLKEVDLRSELAHHGVNVAGLMRPALVAKLEEALAADAEFRTTASRVGVGGSAPTPGQVRWCGALAAWLAIRARAGRKARPARTGQLVVLSDWARVGAFDAAWLHVDPATEAPTHFASRDGKRDKPSTDGSPVAVAEAVAATPRVGEGHCASDGERWLSRTWTAAWFCKAPVLVVQQVAQAA
jgi:hypothetical protein